MANANTAEQILSQLRAQGRVTFSDGGTGTYTIQRKNDRGVYDLIPWGMDKVSGYAVDYPEFDVARCTLHKIISDMVAYEHPVVDPRARGGRGASRADRRGGVMRRLTSRELTRAIAGYARRHGFYARTVRTNSALRAAAVAEFLARAA
jgi:hypothetical protein